MTSYVKTKTRLYLTPVSCLCYKQTYTPYMKCASIEVWDEERLSRMKKAVL